MEADIRLQSNGHDLYAYNKCGVLKYGCQNCTRTWLTPEHVTETPRCSRNAA